MTELLTALVIAAALLAVSLILNWIWTIWK